MRIRVEKWLTMAALVGLGHLAGCSVEVVETPGAGGTSGTGGGGSGGAAGRGGAADAAGETAGSAGASGGAAGTGGGSGGAAGTSGSAGTAGAAGSGGSGGTGTDGAADVVTGDAMDASVDASDVGSSDGADASGRCFAEDGADGGRYLCSSLPYFAHMCADDAGDGGAVRPPGARVCQALEFDLKQDAMYDLLECLKVLPSNDAGQDSCGALHEAGARACSQAIFNRGTCPVPDGDVDGGAYGCAQIAASCRPDAGVEGISLEQCQAWLGPFTRAVRQEIIECYLDPTVVGASSCRDKFENFCVFPE